MLDRPMCSLLGFPGGHQSLDVSVGNFLKQHFRLANRRDCDGSSLLDRFRQDLNPLIIVVAACFEAAKK